MKLGIILIFYLILNVDCRKIGRCQLAKILKANGIPKASLSNCKSFFESFELLKFRRILCLNTEI